jgi:hypothetical protein
MEFLKGILSEDTYTKLSAQLGEELTKQVGDKLKDFAVDLKAEKVIPKSVFDGEREKAKSLKEQLIERDSQLTELQKQVKGNADFELKIKELQETNTKTAADYENKIKELSQTHAFREALNGYKPKNSKALEALIDKTKLTFKDDNGQVRVFHRTIPAVFLYIYYFLYPLLSFLLRLYNHLRRNFSTVPDFCSKY